MALQVIPEEECCGPVPGMINRGPRWMKEGCSGVSKPGQVSVMHSGVPLAKTYKEAVEKVVPKGRRVPGESTVEAASEAQRLKKGSAACSEFEKLMGQDVAGQGYSAAFGELLNVKEMLCKLREEVDVVLRRIEGAIKFVGVGGMGLEGRSPCIKQGVFNQKGKEVGKGLRSLRGFKPKKKVNSLTHPTLQPQLYSLSLSLSLSLNKKRTEMLPRASANGVVWMEGGGRGGGGGGGGGVEEEEDAASWTRTNNEGEPSKDEDMGLGVPLSSYKSMLENDWYINNNAALNPPRQDLHSHLHGLPNAQDVRDISFCSNPNDANSLLLQPLDSSSSCSPSQAFTLDPSQSQPPFLPHKSCFSSLINAVCTNPFDNAFDLGLDTGLLCPFNPAASNSPALMGFPGLNSHPQIGAPELGSAGEFQPTRLLPITDTTAGLSGGFSPACFEGFDNSGSSLLLSRAKVLRPLEVFPQVGTQPTLFQKRALLRQGSEKSGTLQVSGATFGENSENLESRRRKKNEAGDVEEASIDVSGLNYDSDEFTENGIGKAEESVKNGGSNSNANSAVTGGDQKGKKKGLPAKNLMAERRRRKKLNDRLYMLRSVVPKISKMDRASILGDAIDYLKELLQRINDLHSELESSPPGSLLPPSTSFHPLTPTLPTLPCRVKEELCPSSLPSPKNQPARVEVRVREGRAVNIHMFCARRPGLLLSTMRALDNLGLDIQQAVISCFNGFALDVFRAEQCREGQDVLPEQIKAVLLDSAGFHGMM